MKEIISRIKSGELDRETDESYANGFWDLAYQIHSKPVETQEEQELVERIYNNLWDLYESTL